MKYLREETELHIIYLITQSIKLFILGFVACFCSSVHEALKCIHSFLQGWFPPQKIFLPLMSFPHQKMEKIFCPPFGTFLPLFLKFCQKRVYSLESDSSPCNFTKNTGIFHLSIKFAANKGYFDMRSLKTSINCTLFSMLSF